MKRNWDDMEGALVRGNQRIADGIRQTGENASARMNELQREHDVQNRGFEQHEDDISRNGQGFSNYLLDQTVIRDVQAPDIHATVSNQSADFWERAFPGRVEEVPTPQYIKGEDF
jgi:hypothetical protein